MQTMSPTSPPMGPPRAPVKRPDASQIREWWTRSVDDRAQVIRDYWLNSSFIVGQQWVSYDATAGHAVLPERYGSAEERRTRTTVNKLRQRKRNLLARLVRQELVFEVQASGTDDVALNRQRVQEAVVEAERRDGEWELARLELLSAAIDGGVAGLFVEMDTDAGDIVVPDALTGTELRFGRVKVTAMPIPEFSLEPGARSERDARWWIRRVQMTPKAAQTRYNLAKEPTADGNAAGSPMQRLITSRRKGATKPTTCSVTVLTHRPTRDCAGYVATEIAGQIVEFVEWPFPFKHLNLVLAHETALVGDWLGDTLMNDARAVQSSYNKIRTIILQHADKAGNARLLVPVGSLEEEDAFTDEVAEQVGYYPEAGTPEWMKAPELSRWLSYEGGVLEGELDDTFMTHAISRGEQVGDRNSGLALSILGEKDDTPLGLMAGEQAAIWSRVGKMALQLIRRRLEEFDEAAEIPMLGGEGAEGPMHEYDEMGMPTEPVELEPMSRSVMLTDESTKAPIKVTFTADDIEEEPSVRVPRDVTQPRSHAAMLSALVDLANSFPQVFEQLDPQALAKMMALPLPRDAIAAMNDDVLMARYENLLMEQGVPCTPEPYQEHTIHIEHHERQQKNPGYERWRPERREAHQAHIDMHKAELEQDMLVEAQKMQQAMAGQLPGMAPQPELPPAGAGGMEMPPMGPEQGEMQ